MHHRAKRDRSKTWSAVQLVVWAVVMIAILLFVTGCKTEPEPGPTPSIVRATDDHSCGRCFDRPTLTPERT